MIGITPSFTVKQMALPLTQKVDATAKCQEPVALKQTQIITRPTAC